MKVFLEILIQWAGIVSGFANMIFAFFTDSGIFTADSGVFAPAFTAGTLAYASIPGEVLTRIRQWHGKISERFANIYNLVDRIRRHQTQWNFPPTLLEQLSNNCNELETLIAKCRSNRGSTADRILRDSLFRTTVELCLTQVKAWAFMEYYAGVLTAVDVHLLGFFLPGETGGRRKRHKPTGVLAEVKISTVNADFIRVVINRAADENTARVVRGWPPGVRYALIVIVASDGRTEVYRRPTTRLYNNIRMPDDSHGKQFIIKASFLKHVDDTPVFGTEQTFSIPLTTEDLVTHSHEIEWYRMELEKLRLEIENLRAVQNRGKGER